MRVPFLLLLIHQRFASVSADHCSSDFEFAVDNCTACPTLDRTHGDIEMAVCEERAANTSSICACHGTHSIQTALLVYFPHVDGSGTRCANSWETAPHAYTALIAVPGSTMLYATAHLFYIAIKLSGICLCKRHRCTKTIITALLIGIHELLLVIALVIRVASQGKSVGASGADYYVRAFKSMRILYWCAASFWETGQALYCTSISDTLYPEEDMTRRRRCINISFWILLSVDALSTIFMIAAFLVDEDLSEITYEYVKHFITAVRILRAMYSIIFMVLAHRAMHQVSLHPTSLA